MKPQLVHRFAFPIREAVELLLGDAVGDCEAWRIRVEGDEVVVDVVAPAPGIAPTMAEVSQTLPSNAPVKQPAPEADEPPSLPPDRKGGALAKRAGILCNERGFITFLGVTTPDEAADRIRHECAISSRADLDHDDRAASRFHNLDSRYKLWLEGYD